MIKIKDVELEIDCQNVWITAEVTAPLYWWLDFDATLSGRKCSFGTSIHQIHNKEFRLSDFSSEHLEDTKVLETLVNCLNLCREHNSALLGKMLSLMPLCYNDTRMIYINQDLLSSLYSSKKNDILKEWRDFCSWFYDLPISNHKEGER